MKKKITAIILATAIATTACALTACGDDGNNGVKSEKVSSAEEWEAAFDFSEIDNATIEVVNINRKEFYYFAGNKIKRVYTYENEDGSTYDVVRYWEYRTDEIYEGWDRGTEYNYTYNAETEKWEVDKYMITDKDSVQDVFNDAFNETTREYDSETKQYVGNVSERFDDFSYDNKLGAYVLKYDTFKDATNFVVTVKILNGKFAYGIASGDMKYQGEMATIKLECSIYDIGKTVVELPTVEE